MNAVEVPCDGCGRLIAVYIHVPGEILCDDCAAERGEEVLA